MKNGRILGRLRTAMFWLAGHDAFAPVWDAELLARQRRLLGRVAAVAEREEIRLFLFWGTLLGQVREGRMLPWDDDVDLAMVEVGADKLARLRAALRAEGLETHDLNPGERILKVCDPAYPHRTEYPWTWPFVDLFAYGDPGAAGSAGGRACGSGSEGGGCDVLPVAREWVLGGRRTWFEGVGLWEPEKPRAILDQLYPGWRETEVSPSWDHRRERERPVVSSRRIRTDAEGRKVVRTAAGRGAAG